ncbi:hypothetical protein GQ43DRAFT_79135 [Delitschia confertaspora ATCC 74209]|uniref:Uncharacterized protein n=1 Tax=Delitschia confertaspora ATCC 74209 TaxID=1513339 RepID=A0A9P4JL86_9PLEO|nr:hypothetical protein GQ43DRAFT_79135 [Delitschia confertaspora ATCC 74209]
MRTGDRAFAIVSFFEMLFDLGQGRLTTRGLKISAPRYFMSTSRVRSAHEERSLAVGVGTIMILAIVLLPARRVEPVWWV